MSENLLEFMHVWKKFKRGERYSSLRDFIPSIAKRVFSKNHNEDLGEREFWVLKDVSFQVAKGKAMGIIGSNGAGKSTILKLLSGILRPDKGEIKVKGRLTALIEVSAGFHPDLTGRENIYLNGAILGMSKKEIDNKLEEIIEFSGLKDFLDTPVKRYSSGMYARLGFSVAAHVNPDILLVDEVLSVGDMKFRQKCLEKMIAIRDSGCTIIFVSHNLESVNILCPETIYLESGQIRRIGNTPEVIKEYVTSVRRSDQNIQQEVTIDNVTLLNDQNKHQVAFFSNEKAKILLEIKTTFPLHDCLLGFIVNRATDGMPICEYNIPFDISDDELKNPIILCIGFDVNLLRGTYSISFYILHYPSARFLNRTGGILTFMVEERVSRCGIAHLNPVLNMIGRNG